MLVRIALVAAVVFAAADVVLAQDCESMPGPSRTDCFVGRARISGQKSDIVGSTARLRASEERLRAVTSGSYVPKPRKTKAHRKVHVD